MVELKGPCLPTGSLSQIWGKRQNRPVAKPTPKKRCVESLECVCATSAYLVKACLHLNSLGGPKARPELVAIGPIEEWGELTEW